MSYVIKRDHLHTRKGAQSNTGRKGSPSNTLLKLLPGPSHGLRAHQRPNSTKAGGAQGCTSAGGKPNQGLPKNKHAVWAAARAVPAEPRPRCSGVKPITMSQWSSSEDDLLDGGTESQPRGVGHIMGCRG